jgi:hypothetical protein
MNHPDVARLGCQPLEQQPERQAAGQWQQEARGGAQALVVLGIAVGQDQRLAALDQQAETDDHGAGQQPADHAQDRELRQRLGVQHARAQPFVENAQAFAQRWLLGHYFPTLACRARPGHPGVRRIADTGAHQTAAPTWWWRTA